MRSPLGHRIPVLAIAGLTAVLWAYACGDGATEPLPANPRKAISAAVDSVSGTSTVTVAQAGNSDRAALVALYEATDGPNWVNNENWLTDAPLGEWFGVGTDSLGRVVRLELTYYNRDRREWIANDLSGPLPAELGNLAELERLYLGNNSLTGPIPAELGNLSNLESLFLYSSNLTGPIPAELGGLGQLTFLNLGANQLTGSIPSALGDLANLERLYLDNNSLTGPIPAELASLASLERLYLHNNGLTGAIPSEFGRFANLERLYLGDNSLTGPIPSELAALASLERLYLNSSGLTGPIPAELGGLGHLTFLNLGANQLMGSIPSALGDLANLEQLYLNNNNLSGPLPAELGNLAELERLYLNHNNLTGPIPVELAALGSLERLYLHSNRLTGPIPAELAALASLERLYLNRNRLTGPIPHSFLGLDQLHGFRIERNESLCVPGVAAFSRWLEGIESRDEAAISCNAADVTALTSLFDKAGGAGWTNSGGWLNDFALAEWYGISADSLGHVTAVDLEGNGLAGPLAGALGELTRLTELLIGDNALSGRLPGSLIDLPLRQFRYAGTELCAPTDSWFRAWMNAIPSHEGTGLDCAPLSDRGILEALYDATNGPGWTNNDNWLTDAPLGEWYGVLADNQGRVVGIRFVVNGLKGRIPPELGGLAHLQWLQLYRDELTGPIPRELGSLANLRSLKLDMSGLSGPIPPELGNLANLRTLRLDENRLTGSIPHEFGTLSNLSSVNLSGNRLTGRIPPELGGLINLRDLALGGNELTGPIPSELAKLVNLRELNLAANRLTGTVPPELGDLDGLEMLYLGENGLTGPVPPEFGGLASLHHLALQKNAELSGALPDSLTHLSVLETLQAGGTGLCSPPGPGFRKWLAGVPNRRVAPCEGEAAMAYLVQATQSREFPVPLVASEEALLRVFVTAGRDNAERLPPVRASFTLDGILAHVVNIPGKPGPIPTVVEEGSLAASANALIPAEVVRPGLELVIEIDPDGTLDPGLGVAKRIPEAGRIQVDVYEVLSNRNRNVRG